MQVSKFNSDKHTLQQDICSLNSQVVDAKFTICDLEEECVSHIFLLLTVFIQNMMEYMQ